MAKKTPAANLSWSAEQLTRASNALDLRDRHGDNLLDRVHDAMAGHPKAARWDSGGAANKPWCWVHQRDLRECLRNDEPCMADDIVGTSDSTGDQAAELARRADAASTDLQSITSLSAQVVKLTEKLIDVLERWPAPRPATTFERSLSLDNRPGCESCARVKLDDGRPMWSEPRANGSGNPYRTDPGKMLGKELYLCQSCTSHVVTKGNLPPKRELENQAKGTLRNCRCEDRREVWTADEGVG